MIVIAKLPSGEAIIMLESPAHTFARSRPSGGSAAQSAIMSDQRSAGTLSQTNNTPSISEAYNKDLTVAQADRRQLALDAECQRLVQQHTPAWCFRDKETQLRNRRSSSSTGTRHLNKDGSDSVVPASIPTVVMHLLVRVAVGKQRKNRSMTWTSASKRLQSQSRQWMIQT